MICPSSVRACLWSYDITALDQAHDAEIIITNVLNYGTKDATDWLFKTYTKTQIATVLKKPLSGCWDKKSLALWALVFGVIPEIRGRFSDTYALRSIG